MEQRKAAHAGSAWSVTPPSSLHLLDVSTEENAENAPEMVTHDVKENRKLYASGITEACMLSQEIVNVPDAYHDGRFDPLLDTISQTPEEKRGGDGARGGGGPFFGWER